MKPKPEPPLQADLDESLMEHLRSLGIEDPDAWLKSPDEQAFQAVVDIVASTGKPASATQVLEETNDTSVSTCRDRIARMVKAGRLVELVRGRRKYYIPAP